MSDVEQPPQQAHAPVSRAADGLRRRPPSVSPSVSPEQQRLDQQAYLQHALAVSVIGVWHVDIATGAQWWSPETYQLFGVDPAHAAARRRLLRPRPPRRSRARPRRDGAGRSTTGSVYDVEHRIVTPLGLVKWVHERATVERAADGTPTRLVGVVRDISDTRLAEEALRASRGRLQAIVENMPVLMTALDDDGHFVFWNTRVRARHRLHRRRGARRRRLHPSLHPGPGRAGADAPRRAAAGRGVPRLGADDHLQGRHEADHRLVEHLRRVPAAGVVDVGGRRRRHRAQAARGAVPAVAEDGGDRPARRRHRARLQQPAHGRRRATPTSSSARSRRRIRTGRRSSRSSAPASAPRR